MRHTSNTHGFTVVEAIVTIIVSCLFVITISQLSAFIVYIAADGHRTEMASNLAYNNLRLYANGQPPRWFVCNGDDATDTEAITPFTDGAKHPTATGQILINSTSNTLTNDLPPPVVQTVTAVAPYGCGNTVTGMPIRIVSTVTYGSPTRKVVHATYVGY